MASSLADARAREGMQAALLSDGETAYAVHGDNGPWVVLVHGLVTPSFAWKAMADSIAAEGYRVLRYDWLGRGFSDRPAIRFELAVLVRQLRELLAKLGIAEAHFVGWSAGGVICTRLAFETPDMVKSLTLIAPGLFLDAPTLKRLAAIPGGGLLINAMIPGIMKRLGGAHFARPERFGDYLVKVRLQAKFPGFRRALSSSIVNLPQGAGPEMIGVGRHSWPSQLIWGDQDSVTPFANAEKVLGLFPNMKLHVFEGAKHAPHVEFPDAAARLVIDQLRATRA